MSSQPPTIRQLLQEFATAMLITHGADGRLRARPMAVLEIEASSRMWFISSEDSAKIHEISRDTDVHLVFQKDHDCYLSINGHATLVKDREKIAELWNEDFSPWFPQGKDDPEIILIAVTPQDAEYWMHREPRQSGSWSADDAYIHGTKPEEQVV